MIIKWGIIIEHQDTGTVGLICSITALGSGNKIRISITNNEPSLGFNGKMHVRFYMNGVVVDG